MAEDFNLQAPIRASRPTPRRSIVFVVLLLASVIWVGLCLYGIEWAFGLETIVQSFLPHEIGGLLAGIVAPLALVWMIAAYLQRARDVESQLLPIAQRLDRMIYPDATHDARLKQIVDTLGDEVNMLSRRVDEATVALSQTRQGLSEETASLSGMIIHAADDLVPMVDRVHTAASAMESAVRSADDRLGPLGDQVENLVNRVAALEARAAASVSDLGSKITSLNGTTERLQVAARESCDELGQTVTAFDTVAGRLTTSQAALQKTVDALDGQQRDLHDQVGALESRTVDLVKAGAATSTAAETLNTQLTDGVARLHDQTEGWLRANKSLGDQTAEVASTMDTARGSVEQAVKSLDGVGERLAHHVKALLETVQTLTDRFAATGTALEQRTGATGDRLDAVVRQQDEIVGKLTSELDTMASAGHGAIAALDELSGPLKDRIDAMSAAAAQVTAAGVSVTGVVDDRIRELDNASGRLTASGAKIDRTLRDQADHLDRSSEFVADRAQRLSEHVIDQMDRLLVTRDRVIEIIDAVSARLETATSQVEKQGDAATRTLDLASDRTDSAVEHLDRIVAASRSRLGEVVAGLAQGAAAVTVAGDAAGASLRETEAVLTRNAELATEDVGRLDNRLREIMGALEALLSQVNALGQTVSDQLGTAGEAFEHHLAGMKRGIDGAVSAFDAAGSGIIDKGQAFADRAQEATESLQVVQQELDNRSTNVKALTEEATARLDAVGRDLAETGMQVTSVAAEATGKLSEVDKSLDQQATSLRSSGEDVALSLDRILGAMGERIEEIRNASAEVGSDLEARTTGLADRLVALHAATQQAMSGVDTATGRLDGRLTALDQAGRETASSLTGVGSRVRDEAVAVRAVADHAADAVRHVSSLLRTDVANLDQRVTSIENTIVGLRGAMEETVGRLDRAADESVARLTSVTAEYGNRASELRRLMASPADLAVNDQQQEGESAQEEAFLATAKAILEELHALAVDFNRVLDSQIPETVWQHFYKGDIGIFTRRLLSGSDQLALDRVRDQYEGDEAFGAYVQRYIRQFDGLLSTATTLPHGDLVTATLLSSDVGKLYAVLSHAIGHVRRDPATVNDVPEGTTHYG